MDSTEKFYPIISEITTAATPMEESIEHLVEYIFNSEKEDFLEQIDYDMENAKHHIYRDALIVHHNGNMELVEEDIKEMREQDLKDHART